MSRLLWLAAAAAVLVAPASASRHESGQNQDAQQNQASQAGPSPSAAEGQSQGQAAGSGSQQDSLAAAARKARAQSKDAPKAAKVFTNDDLPSAGGISTVGGATAPKSSSGAANANAKPAAGGDEKSWRDRFAGLRRKLEQDQQALDIMQRELGVLNVQQYSDPMQAMQQGYTRGDINNKTADIDAKKQQIEADQQAIDDAEDELRKSGGDPGWAQ